jgi:hypothetical protein
MRLPQQEMFPQLLPPPANQRSRENQSWACLRGKKTIEAATSEIRHDQVVLNYEQGPRKAEIYETDRNLHREPIVKVTAAGTEEWDLSFI